MHCGTNTYNKKDLFLPLLLVVMALWGCSKTQLSAPEAAQVTFSIEWPTIKADETAKTGTIYLYPAAGGEPIVLTGVQGNPTPINLPQGEYDVVVYNENLSTIQTRNPGAYDQFEAFLEPQAQTFNNASTQVIPQADYLYLLSTNANRKINVVSGESYSFKLNPASATKTFRFVVTVKSNIELVGITAALTGVASRLNLSQAKALSKDIFPVLVPFTFNPTTRAENLLALGIVETFGVDPGDRSAGSNTLHLELFPKTAIANLQTKYSYDLTQDFDRYHDKNTNLDILIEIGSPTPPDPPDPPDPDDPIVLEISVVVKPWIVEDGGSTEAHPI